jgi:hypothetical protein
MKPHKAVKRLFRRARFELTRRTLRTPPLDPERMAPPLVVAALGGSGTRIVVELLSESGVFMGGHLDRRTRDSLFLRHFIDAHFDRLVRDPEQDDETLRRDLDAAIRGHRAGIPNEEDAWGWKNPRSMWLLPFFVKIFPGLRFIHLVRDGRDLALSGNHFLLREHGRAVLGDAYCGDPVRDQFALWALGNARAADAAARFLGPQALRIRYEDLCAEPARELARLLDFLDRPLEPGVVERIAASVKPSTGLGRGRLDRSPAMRALGERHADVLRRFDYPV